MKKVLKVLAMLFMLFSTFGSALNAFAEPAGRPASGTLHIHKFLGETLDQDAYPNNGTEVDLPADRIPLSGVKFDVYEIVKPTDPAIPYPPPGNLNEPNVDNKWEYSRNGQTLTVTGKGVHDTKVYTYTLDNAVSDETNDGLVTFTGLSGYYYVEEDVAGSDPTNPNGDHVTIKRGMDPFIVAVPMWSQDGDEWLTDVHVYPKNSPGTTEKAPEKPSIVIGEEFNWLVKADLPEGFKQYVRYEIWDQFDYRLDYVSVPVVEGGYTDGDEWVQVVELTAASPTPDYTVEVVPATPTGNPPMGAKVTVKLTAAGIAKLANGDEVEQIRVTFRTKSNKYVEGTEIINEIENKATVEYTNRDDIIGKDETPETKVVYGEIAIDKKDDKGSALTGAEFQLADKETDAKAGNYLRVVADADGITSILKPGDTGYDAAIPWIIRPGETDNANLGLISGKYYSKSFKGLTVGTGTGTTITDWLSYWLVETKAPENFNMLEEPIEVAFDEENTTYVITKEVVNKRGFTLPETGSLVTILLTVLGIIFIGFSIIMSINKRKKA